MQRSEPGRPPDLTPGPAPKPWRRRQRDIGYAGWASFLMACAATAVFFAAVDPDVLSHNNTLGWEISRQSGYAIGFFGFWLLTLATSVLVIWLVRTETRPDDPAGIRRNPRAMQDRGAPEGRPPPGGAKSE